MWKIGVRKKKENLMKEIKKKMDGFPYTGCGFVAGFSLSPQTWQKSDGFECQRREWGCSKKLVLKLS